MRNAKNYKLALQHMERYYGTTKIMFGQLTAPQVNRWIVEMRLSGSGAAKKALHSSGLIAFFSARSACGIFTEFS